MRAWIPAAVALLSLAALLLPGPTTAMRLEDCAKPMEVFLDVLVHPGACSGIRPGARLSNGCTMSWVLRDAEDNLYVTTAGHCASPGQRMGSATAGDFGTVVVHQNLGIGRDVAIIKVDDGMKSQVNPTMCHFGGPLGPSPAGAPGGLYRIYGWGYATLHDEERRARTGAEAAPPAAALTWVGHLSGGDSGSPVMGASTLAMGIATHSVSGPYGSGLGIGTTLTYTLAYAATQGYVLTVVPGEVPEPNPPVL